MIDPPYSGGYIIICYTFQLHFQVFYLLFCCGSFSFKQVIYLVFFSIFVSFFLFHSTDPYTVLPLPLFQCSFYRPAFVSRVLYMYLVISGRCKHPAVEEDSHIKNIWGVWQTLKTAPLFNPYTQIKRSCIKRFTKKRLRCKNVSATKRLQTITYM